jgi:hypothetical protein
MPTQEMSPQGGVQAEIWSEPQVTLHAAVDAARDATGFDDAFYSTRADHIGGFIEGEEIIGQHAVVGSPTITKAQHRVDALEGTPDGEQTHVYVIEDPVTGDVRGGGSITDIGSDGERHERRVDTKTAQHLATLIAQKVTREASATRAAATQQPDLNKII